MAVDSLLNTTTTQGDERNEDQTATDNRLADRILDRVYRTVRDVEKASAVLDAAVEAGANQVYGVTFTVSDESEWQGQAREKAMADAKARAGELASLAGLELGEVLSVSEVIGVGSVPMPAVIEIGVGGGGMAPGELEFRTQVQVTFALQ
jgi:uncharacterized protein YggE